MFTAFSILEIPYFQAIDTSTIIVRAKIDFSRSCLIHNYFFTGFMSHASKSYLKYHFRYWINLLKSEVNQSFSRKLAAHETTIPMWNIMIALFPKKSFSIKELTDYIQNDSAAISRTVLKLSAKGLIIRTAGKNRKSSFIELTEKARQLTPLLLKEAEANEAEFFGHFSSLEASQFKKLLSSVFIKINGIGLEGILKDESMSPSEKLNSKEKRFAFTEISSNEKQVFKEKITPEEELKKKDNTPLDEALNKSLQDVKSIIDKSRMDKLPYPKTFSLLKEAGVTEYEVRDNIPLDEALNKSLQDVKSIIDKSTINEAVFPCKKQPSTQISISSEITGNSKLDLQRKLIFNEEISDKGSLEKRVKSIIDKSRMDKLPYPKTFSLLKEAGVTEYEVRFIEKYSALYLGSFGTWTENEIPGYKPLTLEGNFSAEGIKSSIAKHIKNKTDIPDFLADIAKHGCFRYEVCMRENRVRYYSGGGLEYHEEKVPEWKKQILIKTEAAA